jgi:DNA polymerase III delta prime subunit
VQPAGDLFTLPPAPDEVAEARAREAKRTEAERELNRRAGLAWQNVPTTYRAPIADLLKRLEHERTGIAGRRLLGKVRNAHAVAAVLSGPTGCGKSTAAAVLVRRALAEFEASGGERCKAATDLVWVSAIELATAERRHALGAGTPELLAKAARCGLLVLDDLGLEEPGAVFPVLSSRYDECRATVVTTGLPLTKAGLTKHLGAAGVRRLVEQHVGSAVLVVDCHDPAKPRPVNP